MEKVKIIRISRGNIVPITFRIIFSLIIFLVCIVLIVYLPKALVIVFMVFLALLLPLIWTLQDIIEINMKKKIIHEYIWFLGNKWGTPKSFNGLEYIFINRKKMNQTMTSWGGRAYHNQYDEYVAYLKLNTGEKHLISKSKNHTSLINKIKGISIRLDIPLKEINKL